MTANRRRGWGSIWGRPVDFHGLQDNLRRLLLRRVRAGQLTGLQLARQAGLRQPHISNFLNSKRGLSLEALDRVLSVQHISILDLVDEAELCRRASIVPPARHEFENVILVDADPAAFLPRFTRDQVRDTFTLNKRFLRHLRAKMEGDRTQWQRFIFLRASARDGMSMYPRLLPGACMLVDRHYNSLLPYHRNSRNMYAVVHAGHCYLRYVEQEGPYLMLHSENRSYAAQSVPLAGKSPSEYIVGRICSVQIDT
jgi:transcriptional regulator with XRE-family HTH domain